MLRHLIATVGLITACAGALGAEAGKVVFVTGQVHIGDHAALLDGAVQEGDEISTGADGYVYMKTIDSGFLILRPNSRARVTTYHIDLQQPANTRVKLELLNGVARSISGLSVKKAREHFRFNTPVAAIGVRGTDFIVYTDQLTSRVAVVSGGVIVSGFAGACGPDGGGPCEGNASRELFAGQADVLLQVQRGQLVPQLLRNQALSPDQSAPPRSDEPVGKITAGAAALPAQDVSLDAQKGVVLTGKPSANTGGNSDAVAPPPIVITSPPVTPPPVVVPPPVVRSPSEVLWGRWEAVANYGPDPVVTAKLNNGTYNSGFVVGSYVIKRLADATFVMPQEGTASFVLDGSEVTLQQTGKQAMLANVQDGHLNLNFVNRSFTTDLTVANATLKMNVTGQGDITQQGELYSNPASGAVVRGYIGGAHAEEAGYIFKSVNNPDLTAAGATHWSR